MISLQDSQIQAKIDRFMESKDGLNVSSTDIMEFVGFDPVEAEKQITTWAERHPSDCMIIDANPTVLKIYGTVVYGRRW